MSLQLFPVDSLVEYAQCPLKHLYRYRYGLVPEIKKIGAMMREAVKVATMDIARNLMDGKTVDQAKAGQLFDDRMVLLLRKTSHTLQDAARYLADGRILTCKALEWLQTPNTKVVGVCVPFKAPYRMWGEKSKTWITIGGSVDIIREIGFRTSPRKHVQLVILNTDQKIPTEFALRNDISAALIRYALPKIYESLGGIPDRLKNRQSYVVFYHVKTWKEIQPKTSDLDQSTEWVYNLARGIENRVYYPRYSEECDSCPYQEMCDPKHIGKRQQLVEVSLVKQKALRKKAIPKVKKKPGRKAYTEEEKLRHSRQIKRAKRRKVLAKRRIEKTQSGQHSQ